MPTSGILTETSGPITYTAGPFSNPNPTPAGLDEGPRCNGNFQCDSYALTVTLPSNYATLHPNGKIKISTGWPVGNGTSDYDVHVFLGARGDLDGTVGAAATAATSENPEEALVDVQGGSNLYTVKIVPFAPGGEALTTTITLDEGAAPPPPPPPPPPSPTSGVVPRYQVFTPPNGIGAQDTSGEMNLGYNPLTKRYMAMAFIAGNVFRVTPPEVMVPAKPESCEALWEPKTPLATSQPQVVGDPILFTDATTGRTFASNFTSAANYSYAYSPDDGETWTNAGVAPPSGGVDHQTIASGPYPAGSPFKQVATANGFPNAVYFCSQAALPNFCQRSDDGGRSYGPGNAFANGLACGGLHGHARVGPDGDVHVPDKSCGTGPGYSVSSDAGVTWKDVIVPGLTVGGEDPSIGIATDGTLYFCNVNTNGEPVVAVSKNKGASWSTPFNIGTSMGIKNAVFTNAIAGDPDRAACAFIGTTTDGNSGGIDFTGVWYPFIAHTYDGGASWVTVNISPNDPVQGIGGVCRSGTTCMSTPDNRNLLDFNEIAIDINGRPAYGYDDGCTGACVTAPTVSPATRGAFGAAIKIARQYGGPSLFAAKDSIYPAQGAPNQSCLAGTRTVAQSALSWNAPDTGGKPITGYSIFRSTTAGVFGNTPLAVTNDPKTTFNDVTQDPDVPTYFYKIVARNELGAGRDSNELPLSLSQPENVCIAPGLTQLVDPARDVFTATGPADDSQPFYDLRSASVSQPYFADGTYKVAFHLRVASLATVPASTIWPIRFCGPAFACTDPSAAISATNKFYTVQMSTATSATPVFQVLIPTSTTTRTTKTLTGAENKFEPNGLITMVVDAADLGLAPANAGTQSLTRFLSRLSNGALFVDDMPDSRVGEGTFTTKKLNFCAPNTPPVAVLSATPISGTAPLMVDFTGASSNDADADDTIVSYTYEFEDGSPSVTQSAPTISHTFAQPGDYNVRLKVLDSRGAGSLIAVVQRITVKVQNSLPNASFIATPTSGNAPLTVSFNAANSSDPDAGDSIASYTFNFGDGSAAETKTTSSFSHTYTAVGSYTARLVVTDTRGESSTNAVQQVIEVVQATGGEVTAFSFIERRDVPVNTFISSERVTLTGFTGSLPISVTEGLQYSINGAPFTTAAGNVPAGATLVVRHVSATTEGTAKESTVTVGTRSAVFRSITTTLDHVPDAFNFGTKTEQAPGAVVESVATTLTGFDDAVIVAGPGIMYRIGSGAWTSARGTLVRGQVLTVQHTASGSSLGYTKTYLKVGGVTGFFTTRTRK